MTFEHIQEQLETEEQQPGQTNYTQDNAVHDGMGLAFCWNARIATIATVKIVPHHPAVIGYILLVLIVEYLP